MGGGGSQVQAPAPTPQETALQQAQADNIAQQTQILQQQYHDQQLIAPFLYQQAGLNPTYDAKGTLTGFTQNPDQVKLQQQNADIQSQLNQKTLAALNGNAPVDPDMQRQLDLQEKNLNDTLAANLGPGYATSTPGIQALNDFAQRKSALIFGAKQGQLTLGEQLSLAQQQGDAQNLATRLGLLQQVNQGPLATASAFGQSVGAAGQAVAGFQNNRALTLQAAMANQQSSNAAAAGMGQLAGAGIGATATIGAAFFL